MLKVLVVAGSVAAGVCWLVALFLPWTSTGTLSSSSLLDAIELVRRGVVDAVVPAEAAVALVVPAAAGIVLVGLAGFATRAVTVVRIAALVVGSLASVGLCWGLTDSDLSVAGPGVWVALGGVVLALQALGCAVYAVGADRLRRPDV